MTRYGFEKQALEKYTRNVYAEFRERLYHSIAFRIKISTENPTNYLVHHYNQSREFAWSRHEFHVLADEIKGRFECESKLWYPTGMQISVKTIMISVKFTLSFATGSCFIY